MGRCAAGDPVVRGDLLRPDAPTGSGFWHWVVFDIRRRSAEASARRGRRLDWRDSPTGCEHARNDTGSPGYFGPAPPPGHGEQRYVFAVHALRGPDARGRRDGAARLRRLPTRRSTPWREAWSLPSSVAWWPPTVLVRRGTRRLVLPAHRASCARPARCLHADADRARRRITPDARGIDLETHITDITTVLRHEDLRGRDPGPASYGGMVITGVADRAANRIGRLVYLGAAQR